MASSSDPKPKPKSVLDAVPVENKSFTRDMDYCGPATAGSPAPGSVPNEPLEVVSSCPQCGSPVYSRKQMGRLENPPPVRHTCSCRLPGLGMQTK